LPSNLEGAPFSILEAMAAGCPIVATAVGGIPEVLSNELNALLVPAGHIEGLARAIESVLNDASLAKRLSSAAIETAKALPSRAMYSKSFSLLEPATMPPPANARPGSGRLAARMSSSAHEQ